LVLAAELLKTAIDDVVNYGGTEVCPLAKKSKVCGSVGVTLVALVGVLLG
jgi:diacylglycerol kinase (ATP)